MSYSNEKGSDSLESNNIVQNYLIVTVLTEPSIYWIIFRKSKFLLYSKRRNKDGNDRNWIGSGASAHIPDEFRLHSDMCACHFRSPMDSRKAERRSVYCTVSYCERNVLHSCGVLFQKASYSFSIDSPDFD